MVDKNRNQWIEEVFLKIVEETIRVFKETSIGYQGIRTSW